MPGLLELQRAFVRHLFDPHDDAVLAQVRAGALDAAQRLNIYRNNTFITLREALGAIYPVTRRLTGGSYFAGVAQDYVREHPCRSGNLHDFGASFADFLRALESTRATPYLADVARLEWAWHEVYHGPHSEMLDLVELAAVPSERYPELRFGLHSGCRLLRSEFAVLSIWEAHQSEELAAQIELGAGPEHMLVLRPELEVGVYRLTAAEYAFHCALREQLALEEATERALAEDEAFDLDAQLTRWVAMRLIVSVRPPPLA